MLIYVASTDKVETVKLKKRNRKNFLDIASRFEIEFNIDSRFSCRLCMYKRKFSFRRTSYAFREDAWISKYGSFTWRNSVFEGVFARLRTYSFLKVGVETRRRGLVEFSRIVENKNSRGWFFVVTTPLIVLVRLRGFLEECGRRLKPTRDRSRLRDPVFGR